MTYAAITLALFAAGIFLHEWFSEPTAVWIDEEFPEPPTFDAEKLTPKNVDSVELQEINEKWMKRIQAETDLKVIDGSIQELQDKIEAERIAESIRPWLRDEEGRWTDAARAYIQAIDHGQAHLNISNSRELHEIGLQAARPYLQSRELPPGEYKRLIERCNEKW